MEHSGVVLLLVIAAAVCTSAKVTTPEHAALEYVWKEGADIFQFERRYRRTAEEDAKDNFKWFIQNNNTWCFCGKENWLVNFALSSLAETNSCVRSAKLNLTVSEHDEFFSQFSTIIKASQCAYDCIFQKRNLITPEGYLNNAATKTLFMEQVFIEEAVKETAVKVIDRCLGTGADNNLGIQFLLSMAKGTGCNSDAYKFSICLLYEMSYECPEILKRNDEPRCKEFYNNLSITKKVSDTLRN